MPEQPKRMADILPLQKLTWKQVEYAKNVVDEKRLEELEYYKVEDVEALLQKLSDPAKLLYITKTLAFGKPLSLEEILK